MSGKSIMNKGKEMEDKVEQIIIKMALTSWITNDWLERVVKEVLEPPRQLTDEESK